MICAEKQRFAADSEMVTIISISLNYNNQASVFSLLV